MMSEKTFKIIDRVQAVAMTAGFLGLCMTMAGMVLTNHYQMNYREVVYISMGVVGAAALTLFITQKVSDLLRFSK